MWYFQHRDGRTWRQLKVILDNLPVASKFFEAQTQDEEAAKAALDLPEKPARPPSWSEWTPQVAALTDIKDMLLLVRQAIVEVAGGKADWKPSPRPRTALDVLRIREREDRYHSLVDRVQASQRVWRQQQEKVGDGRHD